MTGQTLPLSTKRFSEHSVALGERDGKGQEGGSGEGEGNRVVLVRV